MLSVKMMVVSGGRVGGGRLARGAAQCRSMAAASSAASARASASCVSATAGPGAGNKLGAELVVRPALLSEVGGGARGAGSESVSVSAPVMLAAAAALVGAGTALCSEPDPEQDRLQRARFARNATMSHSDVFDELASLTVDGDRYMNFDDFCRARLFRHATFDGTMYRNDGLKSHNWLGDEEGRISFIEFMFLVTVLAVPLEDIAVSFLMCDTDRSGRLDRAEVQAAVTMLADRAKSKVQSMSTQEKAHSATGLGSRLLGKLFGDKTHVSFVEFRQFLAEVKEDMALLEFTHYAKGRDIMYHREFGEFLVAHVDPNHFSKFMQRVRGLPAMKGHGFTFKKFKDYEMVLSQYPDDLEHGLTILGDAGRGVTQSEFRRAARVVAGVELSRRMTEILFEIFDADGNGVLDLPELFVAVHARRDDVIGKERPTRGKLQFFLDCMNGEN